MWIPGISSIEIRVEAAAVEMTAAVYNYMANQVNYQKQLDAVITEHQKKGETPTVVLHSCCAPCSSYCLLYLTEGFRIIDLYYNPNIYPEEENQKRADELKRLIEAYGSQGRLKHDVAFVEGKYDSGRFYELVKGLEHLPEGDERCKVCFRMRLTEAALLAKEMGADYFATTLTISPLKNADQLGITP